MDLFAPLMRVYASGEPVGNDALYRHLREQGNIPHPARTPIGKAGELHDPATRKVRWWQQTAKHLGLIEKVPGTRGMWRATEKGRSARPDLTPSPHRVRVLGFSTDLGLAIWGEATDVFRRLDEPIHLCLSSLPYPLARARAYGGPQEHEYVDWVCQVLEPVVASLAPGGSIALNVTNDSFLSRSPARSLYRERLVLALHQRLGLFKMDELIWSNPSKPPGPIQYASLQRMQLNTGWEPVYVFSNDPARSFADNRRVLQPHSARHKRLLAAGGEQRHTSYGDGAYRLRPGAYGHETQGSIPKNVLQFGHRCRSQDEARRAVQLAGLPVHSALMPLALAKFLVEFLTAKGQLVVDPCAGWMTSGLAAQTTDRRWMCTERMLEYVLGGSYRFEAERGFRRQLTA